MRHGLEAEWSEGTKQSPKFQQASKLAGEACRSLLLKLAVKVRSLPMKLAAGNVQIWNEKEVRLITVTMIPIRSRIGVFSHEHHLPTKSELNHVGIP